MASSKARWWLTSAVERCEQGGAEGLHDCITHGYVIKPGYGKGWWTRKSSPSSTPPS